LGGASLHDFDGEIRKKVESFVSKNPKADFYVVEKNCFPSLMEILNCLHYLPGILNVQ